MVYWDWVVSIVPFALGALLFFYGVPLPVAVVGLIVLGGVGWFAFPTSLRVVDDDVVLRFVPFGYTQVKLPRDDVRFRQSRWRVSLQATDHRRIPLFRTVSFRKDVMPGTSPLVQGLEELGFLIEDA